MNMLYWWYILIFCTTVGVDQLSKLWALRSCTTPWLLNDYIACDVVINRGISWSLFDGESSFTFVALSMGIGIIITLFAYYTFTRMRTGKLVFPHILVLAGAVSNMIDRVQYSGVIDFISLHYAPWHFPIFNYADICIVLGILAMAIYED